MVKNRLPEKEAERVRKIVESQIKAVLAYNKEGIFVKEYKSMKEAGKDIGIDDSGISEQVRGAFQFAGGFHFRLKESEDFPKIVDIPKSRKGWVSEEGLLSKSKPIAVYKNNELLGIFSSICKASRELHIGDCTLRNIRVGRRPKSRYKVIDVSIEEFLKIKNKENASTSKL